MKPRSVLSSASIHRGMIELCGNWPATLSASAQPLVRRRGLLFRLKTVAFFQVAQVARRNPGASSLLGDSQSIGARQTFMCTKFLRTKVLPMRCFIAAEFFLSFFLSPAHLSACLDSVFVASMGLRCLLRVHRTLRP